jgi:hypothetical protein
MTSKLKNRLRKMNFQRTPIRSVEVAKDKETKYYEEMYKKRTMELLGLQHENIQRITGGSIRSQYI